MRRHRYGADAPPRPPVRLPGNKKGPPRSRTKRRPAGPRKEDSMKPMSASQTDTLLSGNIRRELIALTLPLLLSNILQQLYNTGDSLIIARFLGSLAFASTGVSGTLMNLFLFMLNGFCVGVSVLFAQAYGMGNPRAFRQDFFHALLTGTALTLLFAALTIGLLDPLLTLIRTPDALRDYCRIYMTIILAGLPASFFYNFFASVLRSVGNTRWALYVLLLSVTANILLDLLFVAGWGMGIAGAAYATVLAQLLSALCCFLCLKRKYPDLICRREDLRPQVSVFAKVLRFGMVSALHQSSLYIGKILVQGAVNTLGASSIAAYTATMRAEGFVNSFGDSGSQAMSIFISQNYGAGNRERTKDGFRQGAILLTVFGAFASALMFFASRACLLLFLDPSDGLSLGYGVSYLKIVALFYVLCFLGNAFVGWFRGIGWVAVPFLGTTLHLTLRVILSWALIGRLGLPAVALATGAGWMLVIVFFAAVTALLRQSAPLG